MHFIRQTICRSVKIFLKFCPRRTLGDLRVFNQRYFIWKFGSRFPDGGIFLNNFKKKTKTNNKTMTINCIHLGHKGKKPFSSIRIILPAFPRSLLVGIGFRLRSFCRSVHFAFGIRVDGWNRLENIRPNVRIFESDRVKVGRFDERN